MKRIFMGIALLVAGNFFAATNAAAQCKDQQTALDELQKQYDVLFVDLEKQTQDLQKLIPDTTAQPGKPHHINFEVTFKPQRYSFDLVRVTMKLKELSLSLPQVTMKRKSFSIPTTKGEWKVTNIGFGIKTKTWVITTGSKKVSFDIPEVTMGVTKLKTHIPEFRKERKDISFKIPEFKMTSPIKDYSDDSLEKRTEVVTRLADNINANAAKLEGEQKEKARTLVGNLFDCIEAELVAQSITAQRSFLDAEAGMNKSIADLRANGVDPNNVKTDDGTTLNLVTMQEQMRAEFNQNKASLDQAIREISEQKKTILDSLKS